MCHKRNHRSGTALVSVLWAVLLVGLLLAGLLNTVRVETRLARSALEHLHMRATAESALNIAAYRLTTEGKSALVQLQAAPLSIGKWKAAVTIQNESAKVDLNTADVQALGQFLSLLGVETERAARLAARIADWRDTDEMVRINGAEAKEYILARSPHRPANRGFLTVDELNFVMGMTPALVSCMKGATTVFGHATQPDWSFIRSLYDDLQFFDHTSGRKEPRQKNEADNAGTSSDSERYAIRVTVRTERGSRYSVQGILLPTGRRSAPFQWLRNGRAPPHSSCAAWIAKLE